MPYQPTFPSPYMTDVDITKSEEKSGKVILYTVNYQGSPDGEYDGYSYTSYRTIPLKCLINPKDIIIGYSVTLRNLTTGESYGLICYPNFNSNDEIISYKKESTQTVDHPSSCNATKTIYSIYPDEGELPVIGGMGDNSWLTINLPVKAWNGIEPSQDVMAYITSNYLWLENKDLSWSVRLFTKLPHTVTSNSNGTFSTIIRWANAEYVDSPPYYFRARPEPTISFDVPEIINSCSIEVNADYSQVYIVEEASSTNGYLDIFNDISVAYHSFDLYHDGELINSTGNVYNPHMRYSYNNLINGYDYTLKLTIVNDNGVEFVEERPFSVGYELYNTTAKPKVSFDEDKTCVTIDFKDNVVITGKSDEDDNFNLVKFVDSNGTTPETTNALCLDYNQSIFWNDKGDGISLNLTDTYQILHWHGHPGFSGKIIEKIDETNPANNISVWFKEGYFYYKIGLHEEVQSVPYYANSDVSAIISQETYEDDFQIDETCRYLIKDEDTIEDTDYLVSNDLTNNYWWHIIILGDRVEFNKSVAYTDKVVNEA